MRIISLVLFFSMVSSASFANAQPNQDASLPIRANRQVASRFWDPTTPMDPAIPTPREHFGFEIGVRHLDHAQVVSYIERVVAASDRMTIRKYATSHGGRPLLIVTATSKSNQSRLKEIQRKHRAITKRGAETIEVSNLPAIINMGYGVHGDESSATNCAPLVVYYLAAAQTDQVKKWLEHCVIQIDPSLNPDGFNRFANWANRYRGSVVNPDPQHAEHNQMWPPGRVNYYWFDLNRDWLPAVHPESQGRLKNFHAWKPNVVLDFHEMGSGSTYFFQPGIPERTNPLTPARNQALTRKFATFHSKKLDQRGSLYFTQERFDDFYMGKGSTYPDLHGSVGILFEQASARGHVQRTAEGLLTFHDTIANQFTTSLTSLEATTSMRDTLIDYKRSFYQQSLKTAEKYPIKTFVFSAPHNPTRRQQFANLLRRHDIQCYELKEDYQYGDQTFKADETLVVPSVQAEHKFLRSLLMRRTDFKENIFYDVSSWTLPLAYGITQTGLKREIHSDLLLPYKNRARRAKDSNFSVPPETVAYLIDYRDDAACQTMVKLLRADVRVKVATKPFSVNNPSGVKKMPAGTLSIEIKTQSGKLSAIERILDAHSNELSITEVRTGLSESGPDIGSPSFSMIKKPKLAMLTGASVSSYGAGEIWHFIDHQLKMPITLLKDSRVSAKSLRDYTTLILPDGSLTTSNWDAILEYVKNGGNVVVTGRQAVRIQSRLRPGSQSEDLSQVGDLLKNIEGKTGSIQKPFDSASNTKALQLISGAIFKAKADLTHPLMFGTSREQVAVFRNHNLFLRPSPNAYRNPLIYDRENPLMAGYCSNTNVEKFKTSASVVVEQQGRGQFILMADNPNFRGFWHATRRMFLNAVLLGEKMRVN